MGAFFFDYIFLMNGNSVISLVIYKPFTEILKPDPGESPFIPRNGHSLGFHRKRQLLQPVIPSLWGGAGASAIFEVRIEYPGKKK